jgi:hypothetical protein
MKTILGRRPNKAQARTLLAVSTILVTISALSAAFPHLLCQSAAAGFVPLVGAMGYCMAKPKRI